MSDKPPALRGLGRAEQAVMDYVWSDGPVSSDQCRAALQGSWPMKESTVRTVLHRLEQKGYVSHAVQGRTYMYRAVRGRVHVAANVVRQLIDRFCGGSAEALLLGMVDHDVVSARQLARLTRKINERKRRKP